MQLMTTAAIAVAGYVARPLGGWLIGLYADKHGRTSALTRSVLAIVDSPMIAVTPGYGTIGLFASIVLLLARLLQGLSMGDEYGSSATGAHPRLRRGLALCADHCDSRRYNRICCVTIQG
ncbi:hypothetical protein PQR75_29380 [Paraburkholderia fungorum]|uniref:hypothetical protein n=1 Tax=Paraburkholderia fungorum TaxID=134537 RepID=UPI0038B789AE